jgi:predicted nucleic acid-binding protein
LACSILVAAVPVVYAHPLDKKDEPYVNLAIAASAELIVSRDRRHMLSLTDRSQPHGIDFTNRFPSLGIVTPEQLLERLQRER